MPVTYTVAPGAEIRWRGGVVRGPALVPPALLDEWSPEAIQAQLDAGVLLIEETPAEPTPRSRKERP